MGGHGVSGRADRIFRFPAPAKLANVGDPAPIADSPSAKLLDSSAPTHAGGVYAMTL